MQTLSINQKQDQLTLDFSEELVRFSQLAEKFGYNLVPTSPNSVERYKYMAEEKKQQIFNDFKNYNSICEAAAQKRIALTDTKAFVRYSLKTMGLKAVDEYIDQIDDDDLVEVYDLSGIQIFRNLKFFEITTYSIADLLTHEWFELYNRPQSVIQKMFEYAEVATITRNPITVMDKIPVHLMKEIASDPVQVCEVEFKTISPVYNGPKPCGVIVNCRASSKNNEVSEKSLDFI